MPGIDQHHGTTLVLGGTGKTGRRVAERLRAIDRPVRIGSRSAEPPFEWNDQRGWPAVLDGVRSVYLAYSPDLAVPGAGETVAAFVQQAVDSGVGRIALLSGRGEDAAKSSEQVVQQSGVEWTVLRASWFVQNFSEDYMLEPVLGGTVALPAGDVPEPFIDAGDIADVAVAALTEDRHAGQVYELTGPRALTFVDAVAEIGKATGRDIDFVHVRAGDYAGELSTLGVPEDLVALLRYLFTEVLDGRNTVSGDGVRRALGREPRDFTEVVREIAATGVWNG